MDKNHNILFFAFLSLQFSTLSVDIFWNSDIQAELLMHMPSLGSDPIKGFKGPVTRGRRPRFDCPRSSGSWRNPGYAHARCQKRKKLEDLGTRLLRGLHGARVESDRMKVAILHSDLRQDGGDGIIGTIGFHHYRKFGVKVDKNRRCRESMLIAVCKIRVRPSRTTPFCKNGLKLYFVDYLLIF